MSRRVTAYRSLRSRSFSALEKVLGKLRAGLVNGDRSTGWASRASICAIMLSTVSLGSVTPLAIPSRKRAVA